MKHGLRAAALGLMLAMVLTSCYDDLPDLPGQGRLSGGIRSNHAAAETSDAALEAQLGLLTEYLTAEERAAVEEIWATLAPMREARLAAGTYEKSDYEQRLLRRLNGLYETYTIQYLEGDEEGFGYENPTEEIVAEYKIQPDGSLVPKSAKQNVSGDWTEEELLALWDQMLALLPEGAFRDFTRLTLFTDGADETMAYVYALDAKGERWEIAVDPVDSGEEELFTETVLHEYAHYLTLNAGQVTYTSRQTVDTYNERGMVSQPGSYIDDFYQAFWTDYLDDCLVCQGDTWNFFLRHYDDFIDPYASTDPSEDICESFTFFVLRPRDPDAADAVWSQKLDFFYDYPELVEFRAAVRENLGLGEDEYLEKDYDEADAA